MNLLSGLKQIEGALSLACDKAQILKIKLEDLVFRAQRISSAMKTLTTHHDPMYGHDLQRYRREILSFREDLSTLSSQLNSLSEKAVPEEKSLQFAQSVLRRAMLLGQSLRSLYDSALLAHQHIRAADLKVEAWYLAQEIEGMQSLSHGLPAMANKIVISTSGGGSPNDLPSSGNTTSTQPPK